jgi:hypothetical protein
MDTLYPSSRRYSKKARNDSLIRSKWYKMAGHCSPSIHPPQPRKDSKLIRTQIDDCQVVRHQLPRPTSPQFHSLQIGASNKPARRTSNPQRVHFEKAGVECKRRVEEFRVTQDAVLPVGTTISAAHFVPGQLIDVTAKT